ncbi:MAG TPA: hypothetical protein VMH87_04785 [Pseudomonadales bacterium]|nr:hypothetical protein [Pseudomonadales bacterium]
MPRWNFLNILHVQPEAHRLWQFEGKGFKSKADVRSAGSLPVSANYAGKSWNSLWQPKLNVAWLPPEEVFLRVVELPRGAFEETVSMVELQLEKLSPLPVAQIVWTIHVLPQATGDLQTVVVVIAERRAVEEFLGKLEERKFLADRLEAPVLDQLEAITTTEDSAWIFPAAMGHPNAALVAWCCGGLLRNVSFVLLTAEGDRAANLKKQLAQLVWAGELEGWLTAKPKWHLVAEGPAAAEWETLIRQALDEPVSVSPPLGAADLAARTARRVAQASTHPTAALLPGEFLNRYREQFRDRLWLHGLYAAGIVYLIFVAFYFSAAALAEHKQSGVEQQVASLSDDYTNALQLKARFALLQQRQNLKYAALDCWKLVADNLPEGITLQRFGFGNGQTLTLNGTTTQDQIESLYHFNTALQTAKTPDGHPMFTLTGGEPLSWRQFQNNVTWSFTLQLQQGDKLE